MGLRSRWIVACALSLVAACAHENTDVRNSTPSTAAAPSPEPSAPPSAEESLAVERESKAKDDLAPMKRAVGQGRAGSGLGNLQGVLSGGGHGV